jgi:hypothetical protein
MDKTFGFDTAVEEAQRAINSAYIEVNYFLMDQFDKIKYCFLFGKYHHIYIFSSSY